MPRNHITHGMSNTRLYSIWRDMKNRCNGIKKRDKANYYDRGITYCKEWDKFETFMLWALNNGYNDTLTIDRIDVDGNYNPNNCRWVTRTDQNNNTRRNHYITHKGETHTLVEWAHIVGISPSTLKSRLSYGWSIEEALKPKLYKGGETRSGIRNTGRRKKSDS